MMEYQDFLSYVKEHIMEFLPEKYKSQSADILVYPKNGKQCTGLVIRQKGSNAAPALNMELYYSEMGKQGQDLNSIMRTIARDYLKALDYGKDLGDIDVSREHILENLFTAAINFEKHKEELEYIPYLKVNDLAIIAKSKVSDQAYITVTDDMAKYLGADGEVLLARAMLNNKSVMPPVLKQIDEIVAEMARQMGIPGDTGTTGIPVYVLTNAENCYGASLIADKNLLERIAGTMDSSLIILPSSVNELLLIPENNQKLLGTFKRMVMEVNRTVLSEEDFLSDNVYFYNQFQKDLKLYDGRLVQEQTQARPEKPGLFGPKL